MTDFTDRSSTDLSDTASLSHQDLALLSMSMTEIVIGAVNEFLQWQQQFNQWVQSQMMNMQPIPPQAQMDYNGRLNGILMYLKRFKVAADILAGAGAGDLKQAVELRIDGLSKLAQSNQDMQIQMNEETAATSRTIENSWNTMAQQNIQASSDRQKIRDETFKQTFSGYGKSLADRSASFTDMNEKFLDALKGR